MPKFIDWNYPGVIYCGEQAHFDGLLADGGCPHWISDAQSFRLMQTPLCADDPAPWSLRSAPAHWAEDVAN